MRRFCYLLILTIGCQSLADLGSLEQLQKKTARMLSGASGAGRDLEATDYLMGKFMFSLDGKPAWYPEFYPNENEMVPGNDFKPRISLLKRNIGTDVLLAPVLELFQEKNPAGVCEPISPILDFNPNLGEPFCLENAKRYTVDSTRLASLEETPQSGQYQSALVSVFNMDVLPEPQKSEFMTEPNVSIQTMVNSAPSSSDKQALFDPRRVRFLKYNADPNNSLALKSISAQVGGILVDIPVSLPPNPQCEIEMLTSQPVQIGQLMSFNIKTNGITVGGAYAGFKTEVEIPETGVNRFPARELGTFQILNKLPQQIAFTQSDLNDPELEKIRNAQNENEIIVKLQARVHGLKSDVTCFKPLRIRHSLPPICNLQAVKPNILKGEQTQIRLDCSQGGGIVSARLIGGGPFPLNNKGGSLTYTRTKSVETEKIEAIVQGADGSTIKPHTFLGEVCRFNQPDHLESLIDVRGFGIVAQRVTADKIQIDHFDNSWHHFQGGQQIQNELDQNGVWHYKRGISTDSNGNKYINLEGEKKYLSGNHVWEELNNQYQIYFSQTAKVKRVGDNKFFLTGSPILNWEHRLNCGARNANNLCLESTEVIERTNDLELALGSYAFWDAPSQTRPFTAKPFGDRWTIAFGPRSSPSCGIQEVRVRTLGCFTPNTQIKMANGSLKLASDIHENDYVFNPHYRTGIRVRKVVKGPEKKSLYEVKTSAGKVEVTEDHPFLTDRGWIQAMSLKKGDKLLGDGKPKLVGQVKKLKYQGPQDVWNFELDTEDPMAHVVVANGIPTGDLVTQLELKRPKAKLP